nr:xylulose kinase-1 [Tanacetum cinerariifolium]
MVAYLNQSDASEGFNQVIDFLNGSHIKYALTVNPTIYVTCIKQFWNTVVVKQSNDVTRLQALVDMKKVVITEAAIRDVLRLDDVEGVNCLPNEEIFAEFARMGYEKPQLVLNAPHEMSLAQQWHQLFIQLIIQNQLGDLSNHTTKYISPALTQKVFANMRRVGKGCSGVETPLFEGMLVAGEPEEQGDAEEQVQGNDNDATQGADTAVLGDDVQDQSIPSPNPLTPPPQQPQDIPSTSQEAPDACAALTRRVEHLEHDKVAQALEITKLKKKVKKLERANKGRMIADLDRDTGVALMDDEGTKKKAKDAHVVGDEQVKGRQAEIYQIDMDHNLKFLSMQEDEPEVQEAVEVVTTTKLITEVVAAVSESVSAASATIVVIPAATITISPVRVAAASTRRRKGVVIRDPEEESTAKTPAETKSKDKGKDHVNQKAKEDSYVQRYQVMKKRPQTEAQDRRNMIMSLKNVVGFRLDYFKGMSYDDICPIFEAKFNSNIEFLLKTKEQLEEEENRETESINETPAQKAAKRRKLNEKVEELKQHLEIVPNEDDGVYTEATPLARKVPVVDYEIVYFNNKPHYKIIHADGTHQLYLILLVERRYPLSRFTLDQMLNAVRLRVEEQSEMSLELLSSLDNSIKKANMSNG